MKQFLIFLIFTLISINTFSQTKINLEGKYISKEWYGDIWNLNLRSDSTYIFNSKSGMNKGLEFKIMESGKWNLKCKKLTLFFTNMDKTHTLSFSYRKKKDIIKLVEKGRKLPFYKLKFKTLQ